ncbi:response regulator [Pseudomonas syringae]|uniref:Response regulator n=1 Tax=Pseudomonas syringae TaxID=317 RepID=A0A9Q3X6P1_PSESX|nr:response regulator [Pseudomonas syringae]MCF5066271.1 response regulator [Pseudomonas syringae]MCF5074542.1 response regulator [Pseudomonas syringae]MCF5120194.1 response regulator [Pseudomonas syringae]MCF5381133.1 response regulator [Pseudomonas syringae]
MPFAPAPVAPRVLVVDDHRKIREPLATYLRRHTFDVRTAEDAAGMWQLLKTQAFDVVVLDVLLPDGDGFELCNQLHRRSNTPVILLTARDSAADRVRGLDLGADDYVTKPFEPRELVARINSVLRRQGRNTGPAAPSGGPQAYRFAGWHFSVTSATLRRDAGLAIQLSTVESRLLQVFLAHPNTLLPRERLIDLTAAADSDVSDRAIDRQVSRLRRKLAQGDATLDLLRTIWGGGYLLAAEVTECTP